MSRSYKLAVLRALHDSGTPIPDNVCREMIFVNQGNTAIFQFWQQATYDYIDLSESEMFPWVEIALDYDTAISVQLTSKRVIDAVSGQGHDLSQFHAFVIVVHPGDAQFPNPRAGLPNEPATSSVAPGARQVIGENRLAAVIPVMTSDHTLFCHEVGHVLGFSHSFGVVNFAGTQERPTEYGDPYDILSSATFGVLPGRPSSPTFAGRVVAGWPNANAKKMGCASARAQAFVWGGTDVFTGNRVQIVPPPQPNQTMSFRLYRASSNADRLALIVVQPTATPLNGLGCCYVEFRDNRGWDRGLDLAGSDFALTALVAHVIANTVDGPRCWYRGRVLIPLRVDRDLQLTDVPMVVRVVHADPDLDYIDIEISADIARRLRVNQSIVDRELGSIGEEMSRRTPCGRVRYRTYRLERHSRFTPATTGFGGTDDGTQPSVQAVWTVAGIRISSYVPGTLTVTTLQNNVATIRYALDQKTEALTLIANDGDGSYAVAVDCSVTDGSTGARSSETSYFRPVGRETRSNPMDQALLEDCIGRMVERLLLRPWDLLIPPHPDRSLERSENLANRHRLQRAVVALAKRDAGAASALNDMADLRFGTLEGATVAGQLTTGKPRPKD